MQYYGSTTGANSKDGFLNYFSLDFQTWRYHIEFCTRNTDEFKLDVPSGRKRVWDITYTSEAFEIKCNGIQLVSFAFKDRAAEDPDFNNCAALKDKPKVQSFLVHHMDTATTKVEADGSKYLCRFTFN